MGRYDEFAFADVTLARQVPRTESRRWTYFSISLAEVPARLIVAANTLRGLPARAPRFEGRYCWALRFS